MSAAPKIFIVSTYGLNAGDVGILMGLVSSIRARRPDIGTAIEVSHPGALSAFPEFSSSALFPRIVDIEEYRGGDGWLATARIACVGAYDAATMLPWAALAGIGLDLPWLVRPSRRAQARAFKEADAVVSSGGGFLNTYNRYALHLLPYLVGLLLGKKMIIMGQSIGPFETRTSRLLVPATLERFDVIAIREPDSLAYLRRFAFARRPILTADLAFLMEPSTPPDIEAARGGKKAFAVVVKPYADAAKREAFAAAAAVLIRALVGRGYACALVSHFLAGDEEVEAIAARAGVPVDKVKSGAHPRSLKALYGKCEFVVSGLMHAVIFATDQGVPSVVIGYEPKFQGLMEMLSYDRSLFFTDADLARSSFGDELMAAVERVIGRRDALSADLRGRMPTIRAAAMKNVDLLLEVLER